MRDWRTPTAQATVEMSVSRRDGSGTQTQTSRIAYPTEDTCCWFSATRGRKPGRNRNGEPENINILARVAFLIVECCYNFL